MPNFAVVNKETNIVENRVIGDNGSVIAIIFDDKDIYEETEQTGYAFIGGDLYKNKFREMKPFDSWTFDEKKWRWVAPVLYPDDGKIYTWNESSLLWEEINASTI